MGKCTPLSVKQARELGITVPIIGGDGYGDYFWEIAGAEAMKNTFWVSHVAKEDPALKDFFDKYKKQTGTECQEFMNAVMAYDSVYWLADAITRANSTDPQKVPRRPRTDEGPPAHAHEAHDGRVPQPEEQRRLHARSQGRLGRILQENPSEA